MTVAAPFLLFRLIGVMSGFGAPAVGDQRPAWDTPSKSAVLGLAAAALGLRRSQREAHRALHETFGFGVRIDRPGTPLRDFHTIQTPLANGLPTRRAELAAPPLSTILSTRGYRADAAYTALLWARRSEDAPRLDALAAALLRPRFSLCLGRRGCPLSHPPRPRVVAAEGVAAALVAYDRLEAPSAPSDPDAPLEIWVDLEATQPVSPMVRRVRRDAVHDRQAWLFTERDEGLLSVPRGSR